jgi:BON domain
MTTASQVRSDELIREDVLSELKWDPKLESNDIAVAVKDGVVTLSGFVSNFWELEVAEKAAKRVYGVKAVANDLEVKMFWQRTDPEIARNAVSSAREPRQHSQRPNQSDCQKRQGNAGRNR